MINLSFYLKFSFPFHQHPENNFFLQYEYSLQLPRQIALQKLKIFLKKKTLIFLLQIDYNPQVDQNRRKLYIKLQKVKEIHTYFEEMQTQSHSELYNDKTVTLTDHEIIIKNYFFPFSFNKSIPYHQINDVFLLTRSTENKQQIISYLNPFGPSTSTCERVSYIELWLKNSNSHPTFSPENPKIVFNIIQTQLQHQEMKENINLGIDSVKKTIQKGYQGVLNKIGKFVQQTSDKISKKGHQLSESFITKEK